MQNLRCHWQYLLGLVMMAFTAAAQTPSITSFSPSTVTQRTVVTITGTNFTSSTTVSFGGTAAASKTLISATQIQAVVGTGTSGNVTVANGTSTASLAGLTYIAPTATPSTAAVNRVVTDWLTNGWDSNVASTDPTKQPDNQHNLLGFGYGSSVYSTGVSDAILAAKGITFSAGDFRALPVSDIAGNTNSSTSSNYLTMAIKIDGNAAAANYQAVGVAGLKAKDVLIDGLKGLGLGTGVTNINTNAVLTFTVNNIVTSKITDSEPDILITQVADPTTVVDIYCFVDANGNIVGNPMQANLSSIAAVGTYRQDLFTLPATTAYSIATPSGNGTTGTKDIRLIAFKLSDFGINAANAANAVKFKIMPGGDSDIAFIGYNAGAITIPAPVITGQPASQVVCPGSGSATFTVAASGTNLTYQWKKNGIDISGATANTYTISSVQPSDVATYSVVVSNDAGSVISNSVYLNTIISMQPTSAITCINTAATLSVGASGQSLTYQWYSNTSLNNSGGTLISGATAADYIPPVNVAGAKYYYCVVTNNGQGCAGATTNAVSVTVNAASVAGTASGAQTICAGSTATMSLTGYTGNIQWQQSATGSSGWSNVTTGSGGASANYTTAALTATTWYRAVVTSGTCSSATSGNLKITIDPVSVAGTVSASQTICSGSTATITLTGYTGTIQWQQSIDGATGWANVTTGTGSTASSYTTAALTATTYYRAMVTSGSCTPVASAASMVTVNTALAGTISGSQLVCPGSQATVSLTGSAGNIQWQQSPDGLTGWATIPGATATSFTAESITVPVYYRAILTAGSCTATSALTYVGIAPAANAGTVSGSQTICPYTTATLSVSEAAGTLQWQSSADAENWADITGAVTPSLITLPLIQTTHYRVRAAIGACTATSEAVTVTVNDTYLWTGTVSSDWHTAGNWSCHVVPQLTTNVIIPQTDNQPVVASLLPALAKTLAIQDGAVLTVTSGSNITVANSVSVATAGIFNLQNNANLIQNTASNTNSGNITVQRDSNPLYRLDYTMWSAPVTGQSLFNFSPATQASRFYTYSSLLDIYQTVPNLSATSTTTFDLGKGYLIRMPNGDATPGYNSGATPIIHHGQFTGTPNNGTINVPVSLAGRGFNAIGNPYPSPINVHAFINENIGNLATGTIYAWRKRNNQDHTSYATINRFGYSRNNDEGGEVGGDMFVEGNEANWSLNTGQGFIVKAKPGATNIVFKNSMRVAINNNQIFRNASQGMAASRLWLNLTATGQFAQMVLGYSAETTDDVDFGYDGPALNDGKTEVYTTAGETRLAIQAKGNFTAADVVPVSYRVTNAGSYTFALDKVDGVFAQGQDIFLRDNLTGNIHDIKGGSYTFATEAGTFASRFDILYTNSALGVQDPAAAQNVVVYKNAAGLHVAASATIKDIQLYDIRGRLLYEKKDINEGETTIAGLGVEQQMVIVKVTTAAGATASQKVIY